MPPDAPTRFKTRFSHLSFLHGFPASAHAQAGQAAAPPPPPLPSSDSAYDVRLADARHPAHTTLRSVSSGTAHPEPVTRHVSQRAEVGARLPAHELPPDDTYPVDFDEWASPGPSRYPSTITPLAFAPSPSPARSPHSLATPAGFGVRRKPSGARPPPPLNLSRAAYSRAAGQIELEHDADADADADAAALSPLDVARRVPLHPEPGDTPAYVESEHAYTPPKAWAPLDAGRFRTQPAAALPPRTDSVRPVRPPAPSPLDLHTIALTPAPRPATHFSAPLSPRDGGGLKSLASAAGARLSRVLQPKAMRFDNPHHRLSSEHGSVLGVRWAEEGGNARGIQKPMTAKQRRQAFWHKYKCALIILVLILLGTGIVAAVLGTQHTTAPDQRGVAASARPSGTTTTKPVSSGSAATTPPAATPTADTHATAAACLAQFANLTTNGAAYSCASCVPALSKLPNDLASAAPNATAALQFCALRDLADAVVPRANNTNTLKAAGWGRNGSVCGWPQVGCDRQGRVTSLWIYASDAVATLPPSLGNLSSLTHLHVTGNFSLPAGSFPTEVLGLQNLTTLVVQNTAMTGPALAGASAPSLKFASLLRNPGFGGAVPDVSKLTGLKTLIITNQNLSRPFDAALFPPSLTYLDLSYNALTGPLPDLSPLRSLTTLYLQSNDFSTLPTTLPATLTAISLTNNARLGGTLPKSLCTGTVGSCDLRNTALGGGKPACGVCLFN